MSTVTEITLKQAYTEKNIEKLDWIRRGFVGEGIKLQNGEIINGQSLMIFMDDKFVATGKNGITSDVESSEKVYLTKYN